MKSVLHLFIIWYNARAWKEQIISDITNGLEIVKTIEVEWSNKKFAENLTRFYGTKLPRGSFKEKSCGKGPFTLVIVKDNNPIYEPRRTTRGRDEIVNINLFDRKMKYRGWINENNSKIHATNNPEETLHDLTLLLGVTPDEFLLKCNEIPDEWKFDIVGSNGWESLQQMFKILNATIPYVVLRNYEYLPQQYKSQEHGDIDILVNNAGDVVYILKAKKVFRQKYRVHYECDIASEKVRFDFRSVNDNYYCSEWEKDILDNRVLSEKGFYIPDNENYKYSLLYHAVVQKKKVSEEYSKKLEPYFGTENYVKQLNEYMQSKGYSYSEPDDFSVYYNTEVTGTELSEQRKKHIKKIEAKIKIRKLLFRK